MTRKERGKPRKASLFFRLVSVALFAACAKEQLSNSSGPVQIIPGADRVALRKEGGKPILDIAIRLENTSNNALLWSECGLSVERNQYIMAMDRRSDEWLEVWRPTCPGDDDAQKILRPGESVSLPLEVTPAPGANFHGDIGVYRVRFFLSADVGGEYHQLNPELSISRPFSVVDPDS